MKVHEMMEPIEEEMTARVTICSQFAPDAFRASMISPSISSNEALKAILITLRHHAAQVLEQRVSRFRTWAESRKAA
jgi:hypothetical protein